MSANPGSNFDFLRRREPELRQLGMQAERYFQGDPNTCLLKLRQFGELLAQSVAQRTGLRPHEGESQFELIGRMQRAQVVPYEVSDLLHKVRVVGNDANHAQSGDQRTALATLKLCWQLGLWLHRSFEAPGYKSGPFQPPSAAVALGVGHGQSASDQALHHELARLRERVRLHQQSEAAAHATLTSTRTQAEALQRAKAQMLADAQREQAQLQAALVQAQAEAEAWEEQATAAQAAPVARTAPSNGVSPSLRQFINAAARKLVFDDFEARALIDVQLRDAGWEADSETLSHAQGARPQANTHRAIAHWPLHPADGSTPATEADYVLFVGLHPVAVVEAQPATLDLSTSLPLAESKARQLHMHGFAQGPAHAPADPAPATEAALPLLRLVYAANGRPWASHLPSKSGIWFRDARAARQLPHDLAAFHRPQELLQLLAQPQAPQALADLSGPAWRCLQLHAHQRQALHAAETQLAGGQRRMLISLAAGTGKHRTAASLVLHLLAARQVQRVLWLDHDSSALPTEPLRVCTAAAACEALKLPPQAAELLPTTPWELVISSMGRMADALALPGAERDWGVARFDTVIALDNLPPDLQGQAHLPSLQDQLADAGTVLGRFDCPAIGIAAAPTVHMQHLFGAPVFAYSVAQAVVDGVRQDHAPPLAVHTNLSVAGVWLPAGRQVPMLNREAQHIAAQPVAQTVSFELEVFNRRVIVPAHTQAVCEALARQLDPGTGDKTLVCCVDAEHADRVTLALKRALLQVHPALPESAVVRIDADVPEATALWARFATQPMPAVAVSAHSAAVLPAVPRVNTLVLLRREDSVLWLDQWRSRAALPAPGSLASGAPGAAGAPDAPEVFRLIDAASQFEPVMRWHDLALDPGSAMPLAMAGAATANSTPATRAAPAGKRSRKRGKKAPRDSAAQASPTTEVGMAAGPSITAMVAELLRVDADAARQRLAQHLADALPRLHAHASPLMRQIVRQSCGVSLADLGGHLLGMPSASLALWWRQRLGLPELLDTLLPTPAPPTQLPICEDRDLLLELRPSWGDVAVRTPHGMHWQAVDDAPALLAHAAQWLRALHELASLPAPLALPPELHALAPDSALNALRQWVAAPHTTTLADARALAVALHEAGYSEARLGAAWEAVHSQRLWPHHAGWVRHLLVQAPLHDHHSRCEAALAQLLGDSGDAHAARALRGPKAPQDAAASQASWRDAQRDALAALAQQAHHLLVPDLSQWASPRSHETQAQAVDRLDRLFAQGAQAVVQAFAQALWRM